MVKKFLIFCLLSSAALLFAQWEPDFRLTNDSEVSQTSANSGWCVAAQNDTVHVVWFDYRESGDKIFYRRSTDAGVSWGPETKIVDTPAVYPGAPVVSLAISPPNWLHIVWCDYTRGGDDEIFYKRSTDAGSTWGPDTQLTRDDLRVEADSWASIAAWNQSIHVVWHDFKWDGMRYNWDIFYKGSSDGGTNWQPDQKLTGYPGSSGPPSVAAAGSNVHVVWYDLRDGNSEIYYKRSTDNGSTWGADIRLTNDGEVSYLPTIATQGTSVHVCWYDGRDGNPEIYYKRSSDDGVTWGNDVRLTNEPADSYHPILAASNNNIHLVWYDLRDGNAEIYYKRTTDLGNTWSPDTGLTSDGADSFFPSIAVDGSRVHVVWTDERDGNREIYYKRNPTANIGIEEEEIRSLRREARIKARPNPFVSFTAVPGCEEEYFAVYDIAGKQIGQHKGNMIGRNLPPGVYFIKRIRDYQVLRVVKIR